MGIVGAGFGIVSFVGWISCIVALAEVSQGWMIAGILIPPLDLAAPLIYENAFGRYPQPATLLVLLFLGFALLAGIAGRDDRGDW